MKNGSSKATADRIFDLIRDVPGLNIEELAQAVGVTRTAATYAVRSLVRAESVTTTREGRHVLHFTAEVPEVEMNGLALLRVESIRMVLERLFDTPEFAWNDLAESLNISPRTVRRAVRRLVEEDMVHIRSSRRGTVSSSIHPRLRVLMARWQGPEARRLRLPDPPRWKQVVFLVPDLFRRVFFY